MSATFVLDADTLASLKAKELQNVLEKLNTGGTLTQREWDIIHAHSQPAAPQTSPAPSPSVAPAFSTPADIAAFYSITTATVNRCNRIGSLPDVAAPPPWHDPAALLPWYRDHYRSDISKPPSRRDKLPDWLLAAQGRAPVVSTPATPSPAPAVPSLPPLAMPEAPLSAEVMLHGARSIVALKKARFDRDPNDPAAAREYFEAVEKLQGIEGRARKAGATDDLPRQRVCDLLDTLHARIPRRFTQALTAAFPDARRALSTDTPEETWRAFVDRFAKLFFTSLTKTKFADVIRESEAASA